MEGCPFRLSPLPETQSSQKRDVKRFRRRNLTTLSSFGTKIETTGLSPDVRPFRTALAWLMKMVTRHYAGQVAKPAEERRRGRDSNPHLRKTVAGRTAVGALHHTSPFRPLYHLGTLISRPWRAVVRPKVCLRWKKVQSVTTSATAAPRKPWSVYRPPVPSNNNMEMAVGGFYDRISKSRNYFGNHHHAVQGRILAVLSRRAIAHRDKAFFVDTVCL